MVAKTRIDRLERRAERITSPGDRVEVIEVFGDRGNGRELLDVINVKLVTDGQKDAGRAQG